tara:strand:- start:290 stop:1033 length:744 start_codon:yes stop_codon:yes gene_type:complete
MALNDPRGSAVGARGLAAKFMDDEERKGQLPTPPVEFGQPAASGPKGNRLEEVKKAQMAQEEEAAKASENERLTTEQWAELGAGVLGAGLGAAFLGPAGAYVGPALAGMAIGSTGARAVKDIGRSVSPGAVDELRASRGESMGGKRALQGATGAVGALKAGGAAVNKVEAQQKAAEDEAIFAARDRASRLGTDAGLAESQFLGTREGRTAYLDTSKGDGHYGRDEKYMDLLQLSAPAVNFGFRRRSR